jgi:hypothetical protein
MDYANFTHEELDILEANLKQQTENINDFKIRLQRQTENIQDLKLIVEKQEQETNDLKQETNNLYLKITKEIKNTKK